MIADRCLREWGELSKETGEEKERKGSWGKGPRGKEGRARPLLGFILVVTQSRKVPARTWEPHTLGLGFQPHI